MKNQIVIAGKFSYSQSNLLWQTPSLKVYKGYDKTTKKDVHVRVMHSEDELQPIFKILLQVKQLKHTFLTAILQLTRPQRDTIIIITEMGRVCTLQSSLKKSTFLLEQDALVMIKYILLALQEVHKAGSIFGFLLSENIELCTYGIAKLTYNLFGQLEKKRQAPEVMEGGQPTQASDVYQVGLLLYEMLYGFNPFEDSRPEDLVRDIKRREYTRQNPKEQFGVVVSRETTFLMDSLLDYYPENRPSITSVLETMSIQAIPLDTDLLLFTKPKTSLLPELLQRTHLIFRATKRTIDHFYYVQQCYTCLKIATGQFVNLIIPELKMYQAESRRIDSYAQKLKLCKAQATLQTDCMVRVYDSQTFKNGMVIIQQYTNQGNLQAYLNKRKNLQGWIKSQQANLLMYLIAVGLKQIYQLGIDALTSLTITRVNVCCGKVRVREPSMISNMVEKKLKENYLKIDYYAPELKQLTGMTDVSRSDIWSFGVIYYYCLTGEMPTFDQSQKPILTTVKTNNGNKTTIRKCLQMEPSGRLKLSKINIEEYDKDVLKTLLEEKKEIKLNTEQEMMQEDSPKRRAKQRSLYFTAPRRSILKNYNKTLDQSQTKPWRTGVKAFFVIVLLLLLFFGMFIVNAGNKLLTKGFSKQITMAVPKNYGTQLYNLTILATNGSEISLKYGNYSYQQFIYKLRCFQNKYDSTSQNTVYDFVNNGNLTSLCVMGFIYIVLLCVYKGLQLAKLDLPACMMKYNTVKDNRWYGLVSWILAEGFFVDLLFGHFYIFYFQYVVQNQPCVGVENLGYARYTSLYLLLTGQTAQYFTQVFLTIILFSILMLVANYLLVIFAVIHQNIIKKKLFIIWLVLWLIFFVVCRIGFGGPSPLEPTWSYKFSWDVLRTYYGFLGMFPQLMILMVWAVEALVDLVFFLCLRRGVKVEDIDEDEGAQVQPVTIKIQPEPVKPTNQYDLLMKKDEDSIEYY